MESLLLLKLVLTPALIGTASLAGRRWGPGVSGWLVGLPLTSAPIAFFLALGHGSGFGASAAAGTLAGSISQAAFCVVYARAAGRHGGPVAIVASCLAFATATAALERVALPLPLLAAAVIGALLAALRITPSGGAGATGIAGPTPRWDIPARMVVATAFVLLLTASAPGLGARLTGLLAPFPLYATILAAFAHRLQGPAAAIAVLRGLLFGLFAFAGFFLALAVLLERAGIAGAFAGAIAVAGAIQAASLWCLGRAPGPEESH